MRTTQKKGLKKLSVSATWCFAVGLLLCLNLAACCQTSTVVIAEVMYDHPLYDNEATATGHEGEYISLYNYDEEDVDISGWRIEITDMLALPLKQFRYTIPAGTVLPGSGISVIASRTANSNFNVLPFYGMEYADSSDMDFIVLYTSSLAFPDTRSRIRIYDAKGLLQDELIYDGKSNALPDEPILRAENAVNPSRPLSETVSIQRQKIIIREGKRVIARSDYFAPDPELTVQLFNYIPEEYSYTAPPSVLDNKPGTDTLNLSGTVTGNQDHRASNIISSQVIKSGETQYWAEDEIVLENGFELKNGAEFNAFIEPDSVHHVKFMTYNLHGNHTKYEKHAKVIKDANPDVVAIQEVRGNKNFEILKEESGYSGNRCFTVAIVHYGIGILWKPETVGYPIDKSYNKVKTDDYWYEKHRAYMVAEFQDFCFISTHYSQNQEGRIKMSRKILGNTLVQKCRNNGKPIYMAGDMNEGYYDPAIKMLTDDGFEVLNNVKRNIDSTYVDATRESGSMIDLILEHNINPYHKTISRGVPMDSIQKVQFFKEGISDHLPYRVKVKIK